MGESFFGLPLSIQLSLASGYAAYHMSYVGIREHHKTVDVTFISLAFGLIAALSFPLFVQLSNLFLSETKSLYLAALLAFIATLLVGYIWRRYGRYTTEKLLRSGDLSWANNDPTAFRTVTSSTQFFFMQIGVELKDGTWLFCDDTSVFANSPNGPLKIGPDGDIAMYVTSELKPKSKRRKLYGTVRSDDWGDCLTCIPSAEITRTTFRLKRKG